MDVITEHIGTDSVYTWSHFGRRNSMETKFMETKGNRKKKGKKDRKTRGEWRQKTISKIEDSVNCTNLVKYAFSDIPYYYVSY